MAMDAMTTCLALAWIGANLWDNDWDIEKTVKNLFYCGVLWVGSIVFIAAMLLFYGAIIGIAGWLAFWVIVPFMINLF